MGYKEGRFLKDRYAKAHTGSSWFKAEDEGFSLMRRSELWLFHFSLILFFQAHHASWSGIGTFSY
jgi:hypothetical protein